MEKVYIGARIESEIKSIVKQVCTSRGEDVSDFVRRSIRKELASLSYLSAQDKKALGVNNQVA